MDLHIIDKRQLVIYLNISINYLRRCYSDVLEPAYGLTTYEEMIGWLDKLSSDQLKILMDVFRYDNVDKFKTEISSKVSECSVFYNEEFK